MPAGSDSDDAFTLIELLVVALVIAILLAIAIPTFLGARDRASDRATQSNLRNAYSTQLTFYAERQTFSADEGELRAFDSTLDYQDDIATLADLRTIFVETPAVDTVVMGSRSRPGTCFWLRSVGGQNLPRFATNDCTGRPASGAYQERW